MKRLMRFIKEKKQLREEKRERERGCYSWAWTRFDAQKVSTAFSLHLNLSFLGLLALLPQTRKALSSVWTIFSCSSCLGSKSSTHVISWLSRWRRASLVPVDCVEWVSERSRAVVPKSWQISSILTQSVNPARLSVFFKARESPKDQKLLTVSDIKKKRESNEQRSESLKLWLLSTTRRVSEIKFLLGALELGGVIRNFIHKSSLCA